MVYLMLLVLNAGCWMLHKHINFKKWGIHPDLKKNDSVPPKREKSTKQLSAIYRDRIRWKWINNIAKLFLKIIDDVYLCLRS